MSNQNARTNMIKQQLRTGGVLNDSILNLYETISREEFVPEQYAHFAYSDMQIPLAHGQRMLTPLEEGTILQSLNLHGTETVLEIGTGTGFMTAMLSKLCKKIISVDLYPDFTNSAKTKLQANNCSNVELITGDGCRGWLDNAPYDVVLFTGALDHLTDTHKLQVLPGGKLFAILGKSPVMKASLFSLDHNNVWTESMLFETDIPLLTDRLKPKEFIF
ncbi:protein-L-isoaspartate O-methyltransferase family protein [Legionella waltersii]|uniref:Protein-L-isoaspartate O-methyltransferase n=1 Tax=Legionella waltersii TaxID=66969 RepID=A0A0W1A0F1_9GAMM|nr:protein-L-isoaspartate O-methyltransferase [Legionella waltersii]KTD74774.1 protein-L-isoaspartate-O-methyltransferase [Legionella waltersii]SNV00382.1 protein-L-isoaspartate-O-methyltransferase [Legionella waltersii]